MKPYSTNNKPIQHIDWSKVNWPPEWTFETPDGILSSEDFKNSIYPFLYPSSYRFFDGNGRKIGTFRNYGPTDPWLIG